MHFLWLLSQVSHKNKQFNILQIKSLIFEGQKPKAAPLGWNQGVQGKLEGKLPGLVFFSIQCAPVLLGLQHLPHFLSILFLLLLAGLPINSSNSVSLLSKASVDDKGSIWIGSPLHLKILDHISITFLSHNMIFIGLQNQDMEYLGKAFYSSWHKIIKIKFYC